MTGRRMTLPMALAIDQVRTATDVTVAPMRRATAGAPLQVGLLFKLAGERPIMLCLESAAAAFAFASDVIEMARRVFPTEAQALIDQAVIDEASGLTDPTARPKEPPQ